MQGNMKSTDVMALEWVGVADLQVHAGGGIQPWRLPVDLLDFLDPRARFQAGNPSGVRIRFASSTRRVVLDVEPDAAQQRWFDLVADEGLLGRVVLEPGQTEVTFDGLLGGVKVLELWLNHMYAPVIVRALRIDADASCERAPRCTLQRILFHGSSITHGRQAAGPTETWPVGAARLVGLDPINLGLGGACRLGPSIARVIRDLPADYLNFCFGANVVMGASHNERAFRAGTIGFIQIVREGHPNTPLSIQGPIFSRPYETFEEPEKFSLVRCRQVLAEVVECFQRHGDRRIFYGGDLELFGEPDEALLIDGVHPGAEGHPLMSRRYVDTIWPRLKALA
jgi:lysophospholipase L1-like esterase